ncbi:hypothetical protein KIW84_UN0611 [Lathyrus oleraceus]|nr:hypothetical protein KIW84_UN0611 [Pisum sativum]
MHRLGNLLVAIELKHQLYSSFSEAAEISALRVLEALTTEKCQERFSLERLEVLGDAFLKFAVGRAICRFIFDQAFDPFQFYAFGRPCRRVCTEETEDSIHLCLNSGEEKRSVTQLRCNKNHNWLHRKTIADVVEALVGAFIVDSGFKAAFAFLKWIGIQAFVHPSYNKHGGGCYQRLEFLGDAVLDYLITSYLYSAYPKLKPGQLTDLRSFDLTKAIKKYADHIRRPILDSGNNGGPKSPKALGDLVESCIGAVLLDSGFDLNKVWNIMTSFLDPIMKFSSSLQLSPVRDLQELCQSHNLELQVLPSKHAKTFSVEAKVIGDGVCEKFMRPAKIKKKLLESLHSYYFQS